MGCGGAMGAPVLSDVRRRKFTYLFECFDLDRNGVLERLDYEQFSRNLIDAFGLAVDPTKAASIRAQTMALWEFVRGLADSDGDGTVHLDEFLAGYGALTDDDATFQALLMGYASFVMSTADRDGDGLLDVDDYAAILGCYGIADAAAREAFARIDRDGDGALSVEDMEANFDEYFRSDDPDAPGNWMMGPL
jgi:Ca2+-binding EF-hand superfamily protein